MTNFQEMKMWIATEFMDVFRPTIQPTTYDALYDFRVFWQSPRDKGEVGGSSPPRPTIQITSKYAAILTLPLFGVLPQKTVLSTVCQLYDWPDGTVLRNNSVRFEV